MILEVLRHRVLEANRKLVKEYLVTGKQGGASGVDREFGAMVIKPTKENIEKLRPRDVAVIQLDDGAHVDGQKPSGDAVHHLEIYRRMPDVGGVVHTHSPYAVMFAALGMPIPCFCTGQAASFAGEIPCAPYADNQGDSIAKSVEEVYRGTDCPAVLLERHGVLAFAKSVEKALTAARLVEFAAFAAWGAIQLGAALGKPPTPMPEEEVRKWCRAGGYGW